jgi:hypothetical protein
MNIYKEQGFNDRMDYLTCLAEDYGVELDTVLALADLYGDGEDFDGLVTTLEDYSDGY